MTAATKRELAKSTTYPSTKDIWDRMRIRINGSDVLDGLTYTCAEVAENVMMEAILATKKKVVAIKTVESKPKTLLTLRDGCGKYSCSNCHRPLYEKYKFCPKCGTEIKWIKTT